jgi:NADH-quinone oxidoreductase subunit A|tara:strand:+ start:1229 stop:1624 length:396 start_codon:yes stop_codon:yes gene_type:complete
MTFFTLIAMTGTENLDSYLRVAVLGVVAVVFGCLPLVIACLLRPKKMGEIKQAVFECGLESKGDPWVQFKIQYYVYALAFVIFDVEVIFLYPWAVAFADIGMGGFIAMAIFILLLAESLVYLWIKGVLSWK